MTMETNMRNRATWATTGIVAIGAVLAALIVTGAKPSANAEDREQAQKDPHAAQANVPRGPHGGRLLSQGPFAVEVTIFEKGVPPELRVYAFRDGKPVAPGTVNAQVRLERLGTAPETIELEPQGDLLRGDRELVEPHSFKVAVLARHQGQSYRWDYEQEEGRVRMTAEAARAAGIEVQTAGPRKIRSTLQLQGEIQFNQDRVAHVVPRLAGVVIRSARNLGDAVKKGEALATIESRALADAKSEHLATDKRIELARATYEREKRLWEEKISAEHDYLASRQALAEAEIAHRTAEQKLLALGLTHADMSRTGSDALTRYDIRSPIDGVVIEKHLTLGEAVKEDASIFTVADLSTVWAEMTIYPRDLRSVKLGQKVTVRAAELDAQAEGRVAYVGPLVGEQTRSAKARVTLPNPDRSWRPGLFVTIELVRDETEVPVAVPVEAVQTVRDWKVVFGRYGDLFEVRPVQLGATDGKWVQVVRGLPAGTKYAASGSFVLKADLGKADATHDD